MNKAIEKFSKITGANVAPVTYRAQSIKLRRKGYDITIGAKVLRIEPVFYTGYKWLINGVHVNRLTASTLFDAAGLQQKPAVLSKSEFSRWLLQTAVKHVKHYAYDVLLDCKNVVDTVGSYGPKTGYFYIFYRGTGSDFYAGTNYHNVELFRGNNAVSYYVHFETTAYQDIFTIFKLK